MSLLEQKSFIKGIPPFDKLDSYILEKVAVNLDIAYFKKDEKIFLNGSMPKFLYFIIKGAVQEKSEDEIVSLFTKHDFFDPISLIENYVKSDFVTVEECICYLLPKDIFIEILHEDKNFEQYFFQSISQKLTLASLGENNKELTNFMLSRVKDAYINRPTIVDENLSIYDAVKKLTFEKSTLLLVKQNDRLGIVTDSDFREKFILQKMNVKDPIVKLANFNLIEIDENEFLFNAQLLMTKEGIKRLIVRDSENNLLGILDLISLVSFFASHTYAISNEIELAKDTDELKIASQNLIRVIKALFEKGVKVRYISKLMSQLNAKVFKKLFILTAPKVLLDSSVLIVMGSEGREEQILKTDQDNALILADDCNISKDELENFTSQYTNDLISFGYPECDGNIMVRNSEWVMNESEFKDKISSWIDSKSSDGFMNFAIFYDSVCVAGNGKILDNVKEYLYKNVDNNNTFFAHFAKAVQNFETPLGVFSDFTLENNLLNIKKGAIFAIVHGVRSLSIEYNIKETNSVLRLKKINELGVIDRELTGDLIEAFTYFLTLRLKSNLQNMQNAKEISNFIDPRKLSKIQRDSLKDALKIVDKFKKFLIFHYKLNLLS